MIPTKQIRESIEAADTNARLQVAHLCYAPPSAPTDELVLAVITLLGWPDDELMKYSPTTKREVCDLLNLRDEETIRADETLRLAQQANEIADQANRLSARAEGKARDANLISLLTVVISGVAVLIAWLK